MSKRFWQRAEPTPSHGVLLDGKPLRLPSGVPLKLANAALATAVAAEWDGVGSQFTPADIPLTGLAGAAQERVSPDRTAMALTLAQYAAADLLCYRAPHPAALVRLQHQAWQPWLEWAAKRFGARLVVTSGIVHVPQPPESLAAMQAALSALSAEALAALGVIVPAFGSCVLGLAVAERLLEPQAALDLATLDERFQEEQWGTEPEALARRALLARDIACAARFMALAAPPQEAMT